jgi:hypothetical protein
MDEPDSNGSLVPEIKPQPQRPNALHGYIIAMKAAAFPTLLGIVIDEQDISSTGLGTKNLIDLSNQHGSRFPVVAQRHENDEAHQRFR